MCLIRPSTRHQRASQPQWIGPLLARCWRYVLTKKGDDEEGERLHSWLPGERIAAAYYYIKQLGGPHSPQIMGDAFPVMTQYGDAYQLRPIQGMLHVFDDVTVQTPVGNCREAALCSEFRGEDGTAARGIMGRHRSQGISPQLRDRNCLKRVHQINFSLRSTFWKRNKTIISKHRLELRIVKQPEGKATSWIYEWQQFQNWKELCTLYCSTRHQHNRMRWQEPKWA